MKVGKKYQPLITTQDYSSKDKVEGVEVVELKHFPGEDGDFLEVVRLNKKGFLENFPDFKPVQISQSRMLPGSVKAWHLHRKQTDVWFVHPRHHLLVGLFDLRQKSKTFEKQMRFVLGGGKARLLKIPPGIAHGTANVTREEQWLTYLVDYRFDPKKPDEHRLPYDLLGKDFWSIQPG